MNIEMIGFIVILVIIVLLYVISVRNGLNRQSVKIDQSLSTIETYLEERYDVLTKMVASVNEESKREGKLQTDLAQARSGLGKGINGLREADEAMSLIQVQVESYPDIQFNEGFRQLQRSIVTIEDKLSAARRAYNAQVSRYNQKLVVFPSSVIANSMGLMQKGFFEVTEHKREDVDMQELFNK